MPVIGRRTLVGCALAGITAAAVAVPASNGSVEAKRATTVVEVGDDYFAPDALKIKKNSKVRWVWLDANTDTHNVVLTNERPDGVKKADFRSSSGAVGLVFKRKFKVPGKYEFACTYHKSVMRQALTVKR